MALRGFPGEDELLRLNLNVHSVDGSGKRTPAVPMNCFAIMFKVTRLKHDDAEILSKCKGIGFSLIHNTNYIRQISTFTVHQIKSP